MMKTRLIKVKSIENEEIIMAMTMTKMIINNDNNDDNENQNWSSDKNIKTLK